VAGPGGGGGGGLQTRPLYGRNACDEEG